METYNVLLIETDFPRLHDVDLGLGTWNYIFEQKLLQMKMGIAPMVISTVRLYGGLSKTLFPKEAFGGTSFVRCSRRFEWIRGYAVG